MGNDERRDLTYGNEIRTNPKLTGCMRNIALTVSYDGTHFAGWQVQHELRTVQQVLETAILKTTGERVRLFSAGRTDSGVHAIAQVANFMTASSIPADRFRHALQTRLPVEVVVRESYEVPVEFHATYSAISKRYRYLMHFSDVDDPFLSRYAWRIGQRMDPEAMQEACQLLVGTHDFRCFESHWPNRATSIRTISDARMIPLSTWPGWEPHSLLVNTSPPMPPASPTQRTTIPPDKAPRLPGNSAHLLAFEVEADGFLYNMVRAIVGTLYKIGRRDWPVSRMQEIIEAQDRSSAGETAPSHGLYLVNVTYPDYEQSATTSQSVQGESDPGDS